MSEQQIKRITTLVIETDRILPQWILDAHLGKERVNGVKVRTISAGDDTKLQGIVDEYWDELPDAMKDKIEGADQEVLKQLESHRS